MPFADNEGVRIHYETEGGGPPLVLQHWSVATLENWYDFGYVTALKSNYRLILVDARGTEVATSHRRLKPTNLRKGWRTSS